MSTILHWLIVLILGSVAFAGDGFLVPRRSLLLPCSTYLGEQDAPYRRGLLRRFGMYTVSDGERFGHHDFRITAEERTALTSEPLRRQLLDLNYNESRWRRERWLNAPNSEGTRTPFWFYEAGFRNLEDDARAMNSVVAGVLLSSNAPYIHFYSSENRVRDLERLNTLRWACHARVVNTYSRHRVKKEYLDEADFEQLLSADRSNLNVDVFAVATRPVQWCDDGRSIQDAIASTIQVSYQNPYDYLRPSLDGLLDVHGEGPTAPRHLPFMERLDPEHRDDFLAKFDQSFGQLSICEITRYVNRSRTPKAIHANLLLEILERIHERGCQLIVASVDPYTLRRFKAYGFERDRRLPTRGATEETLAILRVQSTPFARTLAKLRDETHGVTIADHY